MFSECLLVACFKDCKYSASYCLVRPMHFVDDSSGGNVLNEYDCPLLTITNLVLLLIHHSVSVVHECTTSCTITQSSVPARLEHENVQVSGVLHEHNFCNKLYCHNIYCMC